MDGIFLRARDIYLKMLSLCYDSLTLNPIFNSESTKQEDVMFPKKATKKYK